LKKKMLNWVSRFNIFCFLDNQSYSIQPHHFECMLAVGARYSVSSGELDSVDAFIKKHMAWVFGHLSYELKTEIHGINSVKEDHIGFPVYYFFVPEILISITKQELVINADHPDEIYDQILNSVLQDENTQYNISINKKLSREEYIDKITSLQQHILRGDCYEINFCQEFFAENVKLDPVTAYLKLSALSPNPFSVLYRLNDQYLVCASPERFLARTGEDILSQPIKGTIKRDLSNKEEDEKLRLILKESSKDQAENVMVVDMVRNDLTRICKEATVKVDELFGIYSFPQVHQMISTISGKLKNDIRFSEIIRATFPMGSMTGAPKRRVMELIDQYEISSRGIFSGSVGYIDPHENFDLNVVIRSIMYNAATGYLSYQVGSGITFYSDPEKEWEECNLKAEAIRSVLTNE
jgi:para-aminobenzoate synthetase component I